MSTNISSLRDTERESRFQSAFLKKLPELATADTAAADPVRPRWLPPSTKIVSDCLFQPPYLTKGFIQKEFIANIPSTKNRDVGLPLILFREGKFSILLTTTGVFFAPADDKTGCFYWPELDFILTGDLASDEKLFRAEQDINLLVDSISFVDKLKKSAKIWTIFTVGEIIFSVIEFQNSILYGLLMLVIGIGLFLGSFFWVPVISKIWVNIARSNVRRNHFRDNPKHYNVIVIGRLQKVHIGFSQGAENIILCMKLGLNIFRAQRRKYVIAHPPFEMPP